MSDSSTNPPDPTIDSQSGDVGLSQDAALEPQGDDAASKKGKKNKSYAENLGAVIPFIIGLIGLAAIGTGVYKGVTSASPDALDIIASARPLPLPASMPEAATPRTGLQVLGRVISNGEPAGDVKVWTILRDESGNRASPPAVKTNAAGEFQFEPFALPDEPDKAGIEVRTYAVKESDSWLRSTRTGECVVSLGGASSGRFIRRLAFPMVFVSLVLASTLLLAFLVRWTRLRYYGLVITSILMPVAVIWTIASFQEKITQGLRSQEVLDLGFAKIFEGRYVKDVAPAIVLSLTAAPTVRSQTGEGAAKEPDITNGFGAPIWVVLVAVVGSALMMFSLIVREIKTTVSFDPAKATDLHERINTLVQHQLFVVFAPLGGIFVYQGLVVGQAASEPVTVALAALGAGATLNALLAVAVQRAEGVLTKRTTQQGGV